MTPAGFPHSDIPGSKCICHFPRLIAAYHVLHRLLVPRHPPCALSSLTGHPSVLACTTYPFSPIRLSKTRLGLEAEMPVRAEANTGEIWWSRWEVLPAPKRGGP